MQRFYSSMMNAIHQNNHLASKAAFLRGFVFFQPHIYELWNKEIMAIKHKWGNHDFMGKQKVNEKYKKIYIW